MISERVGGFCEWCSHRHGVEVIVAIIAVEVAVVVAAGEAQTPKGHALTPGSATRRMVAEREDHRSIAAIMFVSVGIDVDMETAVVAVVTAVVGVGEATNVDVVCSAVLELSAVVVVTAVTVAVVSAAVGVDDVGTS